MKDDSVLKYSINFNREISYQKKGRQKKILNIAAPLFVVVILLGAIILIPYRFYHKNVERIKTDMKNREMRITEYQNKLSELSKKRENLSVVYSVINKFNVENVTWGDKLASLGKAVSQTGWITDFHIKKLEEGGVAGIVSAGKEQLVIKGWVKGDIYKSLDKITKIIGNINSDPVFKQDIPFMNLSYSKSLSLKDGKDSNQNLFKNNEEYKGKDKEKEKEKEEIVEFELTGDIGRKGL